MNCKIEVVKDEIFSARFVTSIVTVFNRRIQKFKILQHIRKEIYF